MAELVTEYVARPSGIRIAILVFAEKIEHHNVGRRTIPAGADRQLTKEDVQNFILAYTVSIIGPMKK